MVRDPFEQVSVPDLQEVLEALEDPDCRELVRELEEPKTARELSESCDMATSTTYRKLERLSNATLVDERTKIRSGGHHTTQYTIAFDSVRLALTDDQDFDLSIARPAKAADERLANLWAEVRQET
jgi:predicted transcriptional regulator